MPKEDSEYEELDELDLIYERTGTLCFPSRIIEEAVRAAEAAGTKPEATGSPSARPESPAPRKVAYTIVVPPSSPASRPFGPSRGPEARSLASRSNAQRTTQPSLRAKQRARRPHAALGQRGLAVVRGLPLAKRIAASCVLAAVVAVAAFVAWRTLVPKRVPRERVTSRSSVPSVVERRALLPAPAPVGPRVRVVVPEEASTEASKTLDRRAADAPLGGARSKRAKAMARSNRPTPSSSKQSPCDCFEGDPLCDCLE